MSDVTEAKSGVWATLKRIADSLLATAQTRVELIAVELREEKCQLVETMLWVAAVAALGMMSLSLVTFTIVVVFWDAGRLYALSGLSVIYLVSTAIAWRSLQTRLRRRHAFADTIEELKKDRACLNANN